MRTTATATALNLFAAALVEAIGKVQTTFMEEAIGLPMEERTQPEGNSVQRIHAIEREAMRHRIPKYELWAAHRAAVQGIPFDPYAETHGAGRHASAYAWRNRHINDLSPEEFKETLAEYLHSKGIQVRTALAPL